jgi:hypothetical protein
MAMVHPDLGFRELRNDHEYETQFRELCGTRMILIRKERGRTTAKQMMKKWKPMCKLKSELLGCMTQIKSI